MNYTKNTQDQVKSRLKLTAACALALSVLAGCGGGGGSVSTSSTSTSGSTSSSTPTSAAATTITGTVATGSPVANATVTVIGANGASSTAYSSSTGVYSASLQGLTAPYLVVATDPSGLNPTLVSVFTTLATVPSPDDQATVVNVTPLTSAVATMTTVTGNWLDLTIAGNLSQYVTPSAVSAAKTKLNAALASILSANGLNPATFDPVDTPFTANQTGEDAVLDAVQLVPAPTGGTQLISTANPAVGITLNQNTTVSAPLAAPPAVGNYLASLISSLGQCLGGTSASCSQAIDASYLDNGFTSVTTAHPAFAASGVTLGLPQTLKFFTNSSGVQQALVMLRYTTSTGSTGGAITVVQKTTGGWDIVGNQQPYNVNITSFLTRRQFLDSNDLPYSRYESRIGITIPVGATGTPNPTNLASAAVTGPGISGTAYLVPRNGTGNTLLALTSAPQGSIPTGGLTSNSNTSLYRWSWQALPGATATYSPAPGSLGLYTSTPINVSTVPQFATYQVTFYDTNGNTIGQTFNVVNPSPTLAAAAGTAVSWPILTPGVLTGFLSPSGSSAGAQTSVNLSWTSIDNISPLVTKTQIQAVPGTGVTPSTEVDGWSIGAATSTTPGIYSNTVTAGVDQNGVQDCNPACSFPALVTGASRLVQLSWTTGQTAFYDLWKDTN